MHRFRFAAMHFQLRSSVILLTVITFQSSQAQNTTLRDCKEELSEDMEKADAMEGSAYQTLCEGKVIGQNDSKVPSTCEKGPGWQGILTKTKNLESAFDWWKLVHQPECVDRIISLSLSLVEKTVHLPKRNCPINLQPFCDSTDDKMLVVIYSRSTDGPQWWSTPNSEGCFVVEIDCDLDQNQGAKSRGVLINYGDGSEHEYHQDDLGDQINQGDIFCVFFPQKQFYSIQ